MIIQVKLRQRLADPRWHGPTALYERTFASFQLPLAPPFAPPRLPPRMIFDLISCGQGSIGRRNIHNNKFHVT